MNIFMFKTIRNIGWQRQICFLVLENVHPEGSLMCRLEQHFTCLSRVNQYSKGCFRKVCLPAEPQGCRGRLKDEVSPAGFQLEDSLEDPLLAVDKRSQAAMW